MLSFEESANYLGMSVSGLRKIVRKGKIRYFQSGRCGRIKFKKEWLDDYIEENSQHRQEPPAKVGRKKKPQLVVDDCCEKHGFSLDLLL